MTWRRHTLLFLILCLVSNGCAPYADSRVPDPIRPIVEPQYGQEYLLYRPSSYDGNMAWPLIVVCHGDYPDNPIRQIRAWTELAEAQGFLVLAPGLTVTRGKIRPKATEYLQRQAADEARILAAINHVRGAHRVSGDRIFLYGWSRGALAALHTGLRHREIFRAISLAQPDIETGFLADADDAIDPHQPVQVRFAVTDAITGRHGRKCTDWLYGLGVSTREDSSGNVRKTDTAASVDFFESVIRSEPWIFIRAFATQTGNPLERQFKIHSTVEPRQIEWEFGDGNKAPIAQPAHAYAQGGSYLVKVQFRGADKEIYTRALNVRVP